MVYVDGGRGGACGKVLLVSLTEVGTGEIFQPTDVKGGYQQSDTGLRTTVQVSPHRRGRWNGSDRRGRDCKTGPPLTVRAQLVMA